MTNEYILLDRLEKIKAVIGEYGEKNFYISFSGGKDSTVLHHLIDMALPENTIPRVFADTGIELEAIRKFVQYKQQHDPRFIMISPSQNIRMMLEEFGYPFKSKEHAAALESYQHGNTDGQWVTRYLNRGDTFACPEKLKYQFSPEFKLKVSAKCCNKLKKEPLRKWMKVSGRKYAILGLMRDEGGWRNRTDCMRFDKGKFKSFQPLAPLTKEWEDWFIKQFNIDLCYVYDEPYNFDRTGCKGCPFNPRLQKDLDTLQTHFPAERKQCEIIWKPVYDEYRRIGFRLRKEE